MGMGFDRARLARVDELCDRYVDAGMLPCAQVQVVHRGEPVHRYTTGMADIGAGIALRDDAVFRIYSMTKPLTSIALMQLFERGLVLLEQPLSDFVPEFATTGVWDGGTAAEPRTRPAAGPIRLVDLLTHTSGLTYGFHRQHPVDEIYRAAGIGEFSLPAEDLATVARTLASLPLLFDPGTRFNYSVSTDVIGRVVEVVSGRSLDEYLRTEVLEPLGMHDTDFFCRTDLEDRFCALYIPSGPGELLELDRRVGGMYSRPPAFVSGGGGLVSTTDDYIRFCAMVLAGGSLDGERIIGRRTLDFMGRNHLPGGKLLNELGQSTFSETTLEGMGFGLGFSVLVDPVAQGTPSSRGELAWGGAASTTFLVDRSEELAAVFMTQLLPSSTHPIRRQLRAVLYAALD